MAQSPADPETPRAEPSDEGTGVVASHSPAGAHARSKPALWVKVLMVLGDWLVQIVILILGFILIAVMLMELGGKGFQFVILLIAVVLTYWAWLRFR